MDSSVKFLGTIFKNPVIVASGTFGFGREYEDFIDLSKLGGISTKGLTLNPKDGNEGTRVFETSSGMMNSIGLQNPGVKSFIENELPNMLTYNTEILVNLGGNTIDEYLKGIELLNKTNIKFIELNISCPNVKEGGMAFGIKEEDIFEIVSEVRKVSKKKLIVKLSPNAEDITRAALAAERAGADALSLVNTFSALAIDIKRRVAIFNNIKAGYSGPAIKPIALRMVYDVAKTVSIPIMGIGGIVTAYDAIEFIMAGATLIQVGTANFIDPKITLEIIDGINNFMEEEGIKELKEIRGII
ncbi:MAG: dihydroorotate dehydrogenase [Tissierellia bacterium]|nr:dihydroorotate dehydrogenase [Tissierellia bacterium]